MRSIQYLASLSTLALLLCGAAFASDASSGKFDLTQPAVIGQTTLKPGSYKAEWTGPDNAVKISIMQGKKTVATASGAITELPQPAPYSAVTIKTQDQGTVVEEIQFNNRKEALTLSGM